MGTRSSPACEYGRAGSCFGGTTRWSRPPAAEGRMEPCSDWMVRGSLVRTTQCVCSSSAEKVWVPHSLVIFTLCPELPGQQCQFSFGQRVFDLLNREEIPAPGPGGEATRKQGREEPQWFPGPRQFWKGQPQLKGECPLSLTPGQEHCRLDWGTLVCLVWGPSLAAPAAHQAMFVQPIRMRGFWQRIVIVPFAGLFLPGGPPSGARGMFCSS